MLLNGDDPAQYDPLAVPSQTGDADARLDLIFSEALGQKSGVSALATTVRTWSQ